MISASYPEKLLHTHTDCKSLHLRICKSLEPEVFPAELFQNEGSSSMYLDNSHTIEIETNGLTIRMSNTVQPMLLKILMDALKEPLY